MTKEARLTQKRLEGEILKLLEGKPTKLFYDSSDCLFCQKYAEFNCQDGINRIESCERCPVSGGLESERCYYPGEVSEIDDYMCGVDWVDNDIDKAIPGALAIYMWLEEL